MSILTAETLRTAKETDGRVARILARMQQEPPHGDTIMTTTYTWIYYALWTLGILCAFAFLKLQTLGILFFAGLAVYLFGKMEQAWTAAADRTKRIEYSLTQLTEKIDEIHRMQSRLASRTVSAPTPWTDADVDDAAF